MRNSTDAKSPYRQGFDLYQWGIPCGEDWHPEKKRGWKDAERLDKRARRGLKRKRERLE